MLSEKVLSGGVSSHGVWCELSDVLKRRGASQCSSAVLKCAPQCSGTHAQRAPGFTGLTGFDPYIGAHKSSPGTAYDESRGTLRRPQLAFARGRPVSYDTLHPHLAIPRLTSPHTCG